MWPKNPKDIGIMQLVRELESQVREYKAKEGRANRKLLLIGFAWGAGIAALACWYLLRHGG